jgi:hypothetical protein
LLIYYYFMGSVLEVSMIANDVSSVLRRIMVGVEENDLDKGADAWDAPGGANLLLANDHATEKVGFASLVCHMIPLLCRRVSKHPIPE